MGCISPISRVPSRTGQPQPPAISSLLPGRGISLLLVDVTFDFLVDLLLDLKELGLGLKGGEKFHRPDFHIVITEKIDFLGEILNLDSRGDEVDQELEVVYGLHGPDSLPGSERGRFDDGRGLLFQRLSDHPGVVVILRHDIFDIPHIGRNIWLVREDLPFTDPFDSMEDSGDGAIGHLQDFHNLGSDAELEQVLVPGIFDRDVILRDRPNERRPSLSVFYQGY